MGHIVDEIVLHLCELLLPERKYYSAHKRHKQDEREYERRYHEPYRVEDIVTSGREIHLEVIHLVLGVIREEGLYKHARLVLHRRAEAGRLVHECPDAVHHRKLKRQRQPVVVKLRTQIPCHLRRVGSLCDRTVARLVEYREYHLVKQPFLIEILPPHELAHRRRHRAPVHLHLQRQVIVDALWRCERVVDAHRPVRVHAWIQIRLQRRHIFLQKIFCLILFQTCAYGIERPLHPFGELVVTHLLHVVHVHYLYIKQP